MHFKRQRFDALGERLHCFGKLSVLPDHLDKKGCLLCRKRRPFLARGVQSLTMFSIGDGMSYVAVCRFGDLRCRRWRCWTPATPPVSGQESA